MDTDPAVAEPDDGSELAELLAALTVKQRRWAEAYAGEAAGNGVKACEMAGYGGSKADKSCQSWQNYRNPKIRAVLDAFQESDPLVAGRVERLRFVTRVFRGEEKDEKIVDGKVIEVRASVADRLKAYDALSKAAGEHIPKLKEDDDDEVDRMSTAEIAERYAKLQAKEKSP